MPNSIWYKGILISQLAGGSDDNNAFDLVESRIQKGTEPPPHVHDREDELFYILTGKMKIFTAVQALTISNGECCFLPRLIPHAYLIESDKVHVLSLITPA